VTKERRRELELESTGNHALDRILGGGIPQASIIVVAGEPGSGKTVVTLQTLFHAARQGKKCVYFTTLSEPAIKIIRYMQLFDFFDIELLDRHIVFSDLGAAIREGLDATLTQVEKTVQEHEPSFVAIDSFRALSELLAGAGGMRPFVYDVSVQMAGWGATTFLVGEYARAEYHSFAEFGVADGIIRLGSERQELTSVRELEVLKLRGAEYSTGVHFFDIGRKGASFYPRVSAPDDTQTQPSAEPTDRVSTGVGGLDDLLYGGVPRASSTIVQGGTGTGKTLLALRFLIAGAQAGERGIFFALEETPEQLRSHARSMGWDLAALEARDMLVIRYSSPVEMSTDRFLHEARGLARELGAQRAVFDSLTTMALGVPSPRRFKEMVYAITKYMRGQGVTLYMSAESDQLLGSARLSGDGVSFISDNVIQLRYVELDGRLERAVSVLKARGMRHESELRAMEIGDGRVDVIEGRFRDLRGVLTGLPSRDPREVQR
jgi:circadian clock protein KaiC